ncbi:class I SAM-dependent methyltransferase [candidate division KSB1 bacterium]|nr:class I SAM-dependent methyltransferase [candidate division KSB1 bacterium]
MDRERASEYDFLARKYQWYGPEILFGLCYELVKPGDKLLDIGIGTGLCSSLFFKLGLEIYGMDSSDEMLAICKEKSITRELRNWDLLNTPLPYSDAQFDLIIAGGVFHFFENLQPIFKEIVRLIKPNGIFAFITKTFSEPLAIDSYSKYSEEGIFIFSHSDHYIHQLLKKNYFQRLKELKFFALDDDEQDLLLKSYVAQKLELE